MDLDIGFVQCFQAKVYGMPLIKRLRDFMISEALKSRSKMPKRIQRKRTAGWRSPEGAVFVGRPTVYGNPFVPATRKWEFDQLHDMEDPAHPTKLSCFTCWCVEQAVRRYRDWLLGEGAGKQVLRKAREELPGKDLICWCKPRQPCHADILIELVNGTPEEWARARGRPS